MIGLRGLNGTVRGLGVLLDWEVGLGLDDNAEDAYRSLVQYGQIDAGHFSQDAMTKGGALYTQRNIAAQQAGNQGGLYAEGPAAALALSPSGSAVNPAIPIIQNHGVAVPVVPTTPTVQPVASASTTSTGNQILTPAVVAASGFSLSSVPWWGWAAAAGAAYFAFADTPRGRR